MKDRCDTCVFRTEITKKYRCDYLALTGHTRLAEPPEACTHYIRGDRLETPEQATKLLTKMEEKRQKRAKRRKYDWGKAEKLYRAGANDTEIALALGCCKPAVCQWRRRMKLPANTKAGGLHGKRAEGHRKE